MIFFPLFLPAVIFLHTFPSLAGVTSRHFSTPFQSTVSAHNIPVLSLGGHAPVHSTLLGFTLYWYLPYIEQRIFLQVLFLAAFPFRQASALISPWCFPFTDLSYTRSFFPSAAASWSFPFSNQRSLYVTLSTLPLSCPISIYLPASGRHAPSIILTHLYLLSYLRRIFLQFLSFIIQAYKIFFCSSFIRNIAIFFPLAVSLCHFFLFQSDIYNNFFSPFSQLLFMFSV